MGNILLIAQIIISASLVFVILFQSRGGGLSSAFGGSGQIYRSKRGIEKLFLYLTIILAALFFATSILQLIF